MFSAIVSAERPNLKWVSTFHYGRQGWRSKVVGPLVPASMVPQCQLGGGEVAFCVQDCSRIHRAYSKYLQKLSEFSSLDEQYSLQCL